MAKTKHLKYERVQGLANVFMADGLEDSFPWCNTSGAGKGLILELGCGKGEHALVLARTRPDQMVVGVDIKSHRLCTGGEQAQAQGLSNLFFFRGEVGQLEAHFNAGSVQEIWITFPDPHPKQREIKHRLTSPDFMALYARLLRPRGCIHLKTDSDLFYDYTLGMVTDWGGRVEQQTRDLYRQSAEIPEAARVASAFEKKALERHQTIKYLKFSLD